MEDRIKIITESNHKILFVDLSNLKIEQIVEQFPKMTDIAISDKINHFIIDITNTHTDDRIRKSAKEAFARYKESTTAKPVTAVVGIRGIQKIIANAVSRDQYFAKDYADAVRWVVGKAEKAA